MAVYLRYQIEFQDFRGVQDWLIQIYQDLAADPGVVNLTGTGDPLIIEYDSDSDEFNQPVRGSKAVINAYSLTDFQLHDLFVVEDMNTTVVIYCGGNMFWRGFLQSGEYSEPYKDVPYPVTITAVDGVQLLKSRLFKYTTTEIDDTYYNGRLSIAYILNEISSKINIWGFTEYVNVYEANMLSTVDDSPFDQTFIDVDIFKDMYCWEVVEEIMKPFNAVYRQALGEIIIYRPIELDQALIYGRKFTNATRKTTFTFAPGQLINRNATPSDLLQFPGSSLMIKSPAKKITLIQDYGYKDSWIDNWELKGETYDSVLASYENWTCSNIYPIGDNVPGEKSGVAINAISIAPPHTYYITQVFGENAVASASDDFGFEFDYLFYKDSIAATWPIIIRFYIEIQDVAGTYWLEEVDTESAQWTDSQAYIQINETQLDPGSSGWINYKRIIRGLPAAGPYQITVYGPYSNGTVAFFGAVKDIKFFASASAMSEMDVKIKIQRKVNGYRPFRPMYRDRQIPWGDKYVNILSKEYVIQNANSGKDLEYEYILGDVLDVESGLDNDIEQFAGAFAVGSGLINSQAWATRWPGNEDRPLLDIIGGEIGGQYSRPTQFLSMEIQEADNTYPVFNIFGCVSDSLNALSGIPRKFVFSAGEYNVKRRLWTADLIEIIHVEYDYVPPDGQTYDPEDYPGEGYGALYNFNAVEGIV